MGILSDIKVDDEPDVRILRRIQRDVREHSRTVDSVIQQYRAAGKSMHEQYVEPTKRYADIIVPQGGENGAAIEMVVLHPRAHLERSHNEI